MGTSGYGSRVVPIYRSKRGEETSEGAVAYFAITSSDAATEINSRATSDAMKQWQLKVKAMG
jgi:hypothetical protein